MGKNTKMRSPRLHFDEKGQFRWEVGSVGGKQKRRKIRTVDGLDVEEFIRSNANDAFLVDEGFFEILHEREKERNSSNDD